MQLKKTCSQEINYYNAKMYVLANLVNLELRKRDHNYQKQSSP